MAEQLSKTYEPKQIEQQANQIWSSQPYFHAEPRGDGEEAYTIVIPPPNVTAPLHLGHALNNTLQDILIRFRRMQNFNTLWMPGTDHAGIATQTVVEKRILSEEGKRRTDFERQEFVGRVQAWKDEYEACIIEQLKAMDDVEVLTSTRADSYAGIVTFRKKHIDNVSLYKKLQANDVICAYRGEGIRFSPHFYTDKSVIDRALQLVSAEA